MTSDEDEYNLPDVHNNIQKYHNKMLLTRDDIVKNIITILNDIIYSEFYTSEDSDIINNYIKKYNIIISKKKNNNNINYKDWKNKVSSITTLEKDIECIDVLFPYLLVINDDILKEYYTELKKPITSTFLGTKVINYNLQCIDCYNRYIDNTIDIIGSELFYKIVKKQPRLNIESIYSLYMDTNLSNTSNDDDYIDDNIVQYDDIGRVNLNQKYKYERKCHFRDTLQQFQGTQNKQINDKVYKDLEDMILKHSLVDNTYDDIRKYNKVNIIHIRTFLRESGYYNHYEDSQLIYSKLTGKNSPNISKHEKDLYKDFDDLVLAFMQLPENIRQNRKNFLNNKYVLSQLLKRRNIKIQDCYLDCLKTPSRRKEHDDIYSMCCNILNWTFTPI